MPIVSVIIPVYNSERLLGDAIQSVLNQTFRDFEIIVVDDGSTDGTEKVVHQFSGPISYHRQENQGAGVARNVGASLAQGEWVAFLDADDIWYPDKLAVQLRYAKEHPEVSFFYSEIDSMDEDGHLTGKNILTPRVERRKKKKRQNLVSIIFGDRPVPNPPTVLMRKDVFLKVGGFSPAFPSRYHEDFEFFARVSRNYSMYFIPQSLARCRIRFSQDRNVDSTYEKNWLVFLNSLWAMWREEPEKQVVLLYYYAKYFSDHGKYYLESGAYEKARRYFRLAFSYRVFYWKNFSRWVLSYFPGLGKL